MVECGDILETPFGYLLVEKIVSKNHFIGHKLTDRITYKTTDAPKIVCSDFRYCKEAQMKLDIEKEERK